MNPVRTTAAHQTRPCLGGEEFDDVGGAGVTRTSQHDLVVVYASHQPCLVCPWSHPSTPGRVSSIPPGMDRSGSVRPRMTVAAPGQYRWLHGIVKALLVLNLADALFTLYWVRAGHALEANDLIADLVNEHAVTFVVVKLSLVGLGSLLLWRRRRNPAAVVGIFVVFLVYYGILLIHLSHVGDMMREILASL